MNENIFEIAAANKYRFPFRGAITTEDLYDLSPADLDKVFRALNAEKKKADEESLLSSQTIEDKTLTRKLAIVRHVFDVKQAEIAAKKQAKENADKKKRIMEILAQKQDASLQNKSEDELLALLAELG